jgi:hypothetical protein
MHHQDARRVVDARIESSPASWALPGRGGGAVLNYFGGEGSR